MKKEGLSPIISLFLACPPDQRLLFIIFTRKFTHFLDPVFILSLATEEDVRLETADESPNEGHSRSEGQVSDRRKVVALIHYGEEEGPDEHQQPVEHIDTW